MNRKKEYRMGIRLDDSVKKQLKRIAKKKQTTLSSLIRHILEDYIKAIACREITDKEIDEMD